MPANKLRIPTAEVFEPLLHPARYKGAWGVYILSVPPYASFMNVEKPKKRRLKDYRGIRFNRLVGVKMIAIDASKENNHLWLFDCDCGAQKEARIKNVRSGKTTSCGCAFKEMMGSRNQKHGLSKCKSYRTWKDMRARCRNPNDTDFGLYGGRGISICERWDNFSLFYADMGERPDGMTLDRIDVDGDYSPENCRWANAETQANNKRSNLKIEFGGETLTLQQWANKTGIKRETIAARLKSGWSVSDALNRGPSASSLCVGGGHGQ